MSSIATDNLLLAAPEVAIEAGGERKKPRISVVAYTGGLMNVPGWGPVAIDLGGLDAAGQVPLLADHAPAWGATFEVYPKALDQEVSIHAPAWGATGQS